MIDTSVQSGERETILHCRRWQATLAMMLCLMVFVWGTSSKLALYHPPKPDSLPQAKLCSGYVERSMVALSGKPSSAPQPSALLSTFVLAAAVPPARILRALELNWAGSAFLTAISAPALFHRPPPIR